MLTYITARSFSKVSILLCCVLALAACGGGGDSEAPVSNNQAPTNVALTTVHASSFDAVDVAWALAKDDKTIANTLTYQVHLSESADFSPSSTTLKFSQKGSIATQLTGLKSATAYHLKLVVIDDDGAQTVSAEKVVTTPSINVTNKAPTNVNLTLVDIISSTELNVSWRAAQDDYTAINQLNYELHIAEGGDFSPSASTLVFSGKNVLTTQVLGLKATTTYTLKLVAIDEQGLRTNTGVNFTTPITTINKAPTNVLLSAVTAYSPTAVNVVWGAASDDSTPTDLLTYEVHMAEGGSFTPSATTLKFSGKNVLSTQVTGLKVATAYTTILVAVDYRGLRGSSGGVSVTTQNIFVTTSRKLNDTGITQCANDNIVFADCSADSLGTWFGLNQDGEIGRDFLAVNGLLTKVGAGDAGFDFTKISAAGQKLPANATVWSCVLDNHTGLMWEAKTNDGGLYDKDNTYQWYNQDTSTNGGKVGYENGGNNTQAFSQAVNAKALCGYTDWRLPSKQELHSIVNYGKYHPSIDSTYFPNTQTNSYLSSSTAAEDSELVLLVNFDYGLDLEFNKSSGGLYVRLVR